MIRHKRRTVRTLGAVLAAGMGGAAAMGQVLLVGPHALSAGGLIVLITVPLGVLLGFGYAVRIVTRAAFPVRTLLRLSAEAVLIGAVVISTIVAFTDLYGPIPVDPLVFAWRLLVYAGYGLALFGVPLYLATIGYAVIWATLLRWLSSVTNLADPIARP